jgi:4-amino-4-deoxy-L-arabinose transferase-like glycosyltransferase
MMVRWISGFLEAFVLTAPLTGLWLWFYDGRLRAARARERALERDLALWQFKWRRLLDAVVFHEEHPGAPRPYWFAEVFDERWHVFIDHSALEKRFDDTH